MNVIVHLILIVLTWSFSRFSSRCPVNYAIYQSDSCLNSFECISNNSYYGSRCKLQATRHVHCVAIYSVLDWWHRHTNIVAFSYIDASKKTIDKTKNSSSISYTIAKHVLQTWHYIAKGFIYKSNFFSYILNLFYEYKIDWGVFKD
jgi:hypothetical protein